MHLPHPRWIVIVFVCLLGLPATAQNFGNGQDTLPAPPVTDEQPLEVAEEAEVPGEVEPVAVFAGLNVVSQYISRGLGFSDEVSFQPWIEVYFKLPEPTGQDVLDNWSVFFGNWNSLQGGGPGLGQTRDRGTLDNWYETDLYTGITFTVQERLSGSIAYYRYESPSDSFAGYNEVELKFNYDDGGMHGSVPLKSFGFNPALRVTHEFGRADEDGLYVQPSLTPSFVVEPAYDLPITIAVPLVVGFGQDFYSDQDGDDVTYGFFATGVSFASPLKLLPAETGALTLTGGIDLIFPSDNVASGLDDDTELVGRIGLTWAY